MTTVTTEQGTFTLKNGDHFEADTNPGAIWRNSKGTIFWLINSPKGVLIRYASGVRKFVCK